MPRHILHTQHNKRRGTEHTDRPAAAAWMIGWKTMHASSSSSASSSPSIQYCFCASVPCALVSRQTLESVLHSLAIQTDLMHLWQHTQTAPQLLAIMEAEKEKDLLHMRMTADDCMSVIVQLAHVSAFSSSSPLSVTAQIILFDAPQPPHFFATTNAFHSLALDPHYANTSVSEELAVPLSALEVGLRCCNACIPTETILHEWIQQQQQQKQNAHPHPIADAVSISATFNSSSSTRQRSKSSNRSIKKEAQSIMPAGDAQAVEFDFEARPCHTHTCGRLHACKRVICAPFLFIMQHILSLFFLFVSAVLPFFDLPVFSLSKLFGSIFAPPYHAGVLQKKLSLDSIPLWQGSYASQSIYAKLHFCMQTKQSWLSMQHMEQLQCNIGCSTSLRLRQRVWDGIISHVCDVISGVSIGIIILGLLGTFDSNQWVQSYWHEGSKEEGDSSTAPLFVCIRQHLFQFPSSVASLVSSFVSTSFSPSGFFSSSSPAGLKLNPRLHKQFGLFLQQILNDQRIITKGVNEFIQGSRMANNVVHAICGALAITTMCVGASFFFAVVLDILWFLSLPLSLLHATLSRISSFILSLTSSLFLLFRGQKRNVLRFGRLDSFPLHSNLEHLFLGTLGLSICLMLTMTIGLWHIGSICAMMAMVEIPMAGIWMIRMCMEWMPMFICKLIMQDRWKQICGRWNEGKKGTGGNGVPAGIWLEVITPNIVATSSSFSLSSSSFLCSTTYLSLHSSPASFLTVLFPFRVWLHRVRHRHPPHAVWNRLIWSSEERS